MSSSSPGPARAWPPPASAAAPAGRPVVATPEIIAAARDLLPNPAHSITSIASLLGVSPGTLYNHIPDLRELRQARAARAVLPADTRPVPSVATYDDLLPSRRASGHNRRPTAAAPRPGSKSWSSLKLLSNRVPRYPAREQVTPVCHSAARLG